MSRDRVLAWTLVAPFAIAAVLAVWRLGVDARSAAGRRAATAADSTAAALRPGPAGMGPAGLGDRLQQLGRAGFAAGWYDAASGDTLVARTIDAIPLPDRLPAGLLDRLASLDHTFVTRIGGRTAALAPVKDADQWDRIGALLVVAAAPEPALFPSGAAAGALLALLLTAIAARAHGKRPGTATAALAFLPAIAFAVLMVRAPVPGAASAGSHGFWAVLLIAGWSVLAAIGLSLARVAAAPLRLAEAARAWTFLAPSFAHLLVFSIGPILFALWLSFHQWNLLSPERPFVGLGNYRELAADADFWRAVRNTAVYVLFVPAGMVLALGLALLVNRRMPGVNWLRAAFFLPYVTSFVAISLIWKWMLQPDVGLLNNLLGRIGVPPQPWLSSPSTALPSLMLMSVWMYAGYMMVIFLAGLQNIPASLYESARIDGAGPWRRFRHITLPMLRPTTLFILVTMVIFMFQVFTAVYVMTEGGPLHATDVIVYHIYRNAWEYLRMGYASAMAWVLFALVFLVTLVQFRWLGGRPAE
ncbi:MAG: sugar ABC transporter permease [Gemmatimonadota bacterium]|jgi:multiple sugar transport system permease protein